MRKNRRYAENIMGRFPVVSMSLKSVEASSFDGAKQMLAKIVNEEARRLQFLLQSSELTDIDKKYFCLCLMKICRKVRWFTVFVN